jgi:hypothetical protein
MGAGLPRLAEAEPGKGASKVRGNGSAAAHDRTSPAWLLAFSIATGAGKKLIATENILLNNIFVFTKPAKAMGAVVAVKRRIILCKSPLSLA